MQIRHSLGIAIPLLQLHALFSPTAGEAIKFAVIPKSVGDPYFDSVRDGCMSAAEELGVECLYTGPTGADASRQAEIIEDLFLEGVSGIAVAVTDQATLTEAIDGATSRGIPVVTFDTDAPNTTRIAYIGTDNLSFGESLGNSLMQMSPGGGKYAIISQDTEPNLAQRTAGIKKQLSGEKSMWVEAADSPSEAESNTDLALRQMWEFAKDPQVKAIIGCCGWPMYYAKGFKEFVKANPNITVIMGDSTPEQLVLFNEGYADGLVGQLPYRMGYLSIKTLFDFVGGNKTTDTTFQTSLLQYNQIPVNLPEYEEEKQYLGQLSIAGYTFFGFITLLCIGSSVFIGICHAHRVIRSSQPIFLILIIVGVFLMACALIPLSIDDGNFSPEAASIACMCIPWLLSLGFSLVLSMLFAKTWTIFMISKSAPSMKRLFVGAKDVLIPTGVLLGLNIVVLICWTTISPLTFMRVYHEATDGWNRPIGSYGTCQSQHSLVFSSILICIAFIVLILALVQAYRTRLFRIEHAESTYIGMALISMLQALIIALPVIIMSEDQPQINYIMWVLIISILSVSIICFIFIPKIIINATNRSSGFVGDGLGVEMLAVTKSSKDSSGSKKPPQAMKAPPKKAKFTFSKIGKPSLPKPNLPSLKKKSPNDSNKPSAPAGGGKAAAMRAAIEKRKQAAKAKEDEQDTFTTTKK